MCSRVQWCIMVYMWRVVVCNAYCLPSKHVAVNQMFFSDYSVTLVSSGMCFRDLTVESYGKLPQQTESNFDFFNYCFILWTIKAFTFRYGKCRNTRLLVYCIISFVFEPSISYRPTNFKRHKNEMISEKYNYYTGQHKLLFI